MEPAMNSEAAGQGMLTINFTIRDSVGLLDTNFIAPLVINLGRVVNGSIVILTRHLTYFGAKVAQPLLALGVGALQMRVGEQVALWSFGGWGDGTRSFSSLTPSTCSATATGVAIGIKAGTCDVVTTKSGDSTFLNNVSGPVELVVSKATELRTMSVTGAGPYKLIQLSFGLTNANSLVTIQIRKPGGTRFSTLLNHELNNAGKLHTHQLVSSGSVVRVVRSGEVLATTTVK